MKANRLIFICLLVVSVCMSLVSTSPTPVSARENAVESNQPVRRPFHISLSEGLQQKSLNAAGSSTSALIETGRPKEQNLQAPALAVDTITIMTEDFEGNFPEDNGWLLNDASSNDGGEYLYGAVTRRYRTGSRSGWEAVGGANGFGVTGSGTFPNNMNTAMVYGPFSLADATAARLNFYYWSRMLGINPQDGAGVGASTDGVQFAGFMFGGSSASWVADTLDFNNVDGGNTSFIGEPQVWIMFVFLSDGQTSTSEGIYFDDIVLQKDVDPSISCFTLTTSINPPGSGTVAASPAPNCTGGRYTNDTTVQLTATASGGYGFTNWTGAFTETDPTINVPMTGDRLITANFSPLPCYTLTTSVDPASSGTISRDIQPNCNSGTQYTSGTRVRLTATPSPTYGFTDWTGGASGTNPVVDVEITGALTVTANFAPLPCYSLTATENPTSGGTISRDIQPNCNGGTQYYSDTTVELTATAGSGYTFTNWTGAVPATTPTIEVEMTANRSVTANFTLIPPCYTLSTTVDPSGGGTVAASPASNCTGGKYTSGTQVQLTAIPASGYNFASWGGGASGADNPVTVTMTADRAVIANFSLIPCYTLSTTISPTGGGSVAANPTPNCTGGKYTSGTSVQLTATPGSGYNFANWTGAVTGATNPVNVTMTADRTVTANFTTNNPAPVLSSVTPNQITAGAANTLLTITGTGFIPSSSIRWNGATMSSPQYVSATELRITVPASSLTTPGVVHITVVNPTPGGGTSNTIDIQIAESQPQIEDYKIFLPITKR